MKKRYFAKFLGKIDLGLIRGETRFSEIITNDQITSDFYKERPFRESIHFDAGKRIAKLIKLVTSDAIDEKLFFVYSLEAVQFRPINC